MYCSQCGQQNPDGAQFCNGCGAAMQVTPEIKKEEKKKINPREVCFPFLKEVLNGPLLLAAAISYSIIVLLNFLQLNSAENSLLQMLGIYASLDGLETLSALQWISVFCCLDIAVGLWCTFANVYSKEQFPVNAIGLKMIRIGVIVNAIAAVLCVFVMASYITDLLGYYASEYKNTAILVAILYSVVLAVFTSVYVKNLNSAAEVLECGIPNIGVSKVMAVLLIIIGCLCGLLMFFGSFSITLLAEALSNIFFGSLMFKFRSQMELASVRINTLLKAAEQKR